jgi:hypothetical protein
MQLEEKNRSRSVSVLTPIDKEASCSGRRMARSVAAVGFLVRRLVIARWSPSARTSPWHPLPAAKTPMQWHKTNEQNTQSQQEKKWLL